MATSAAAPARLQYGLFALRITVFIVFAMWTLDKFVNPGHTAAVFENFYFISGLSAVAAYVIGAVQALVVLAFVAGYLKRYSYGLILLLHLVSTLSAFGRYIDPWTGGNLLFFAAWPMLAAAFVLYLLRDEDRFLAIER